VLAPTVLLDEVDLLSGTHIGLLAPELSHGSGDGHALASPHPQKID
jgi:hypothetical protein